MRRQKTNQDRTAKGLGAVNEDGFGCRKCSNYVGFSWGIGGMVSEIESFMF